MQRDLPREGSRLSASRGRGVAAERKNTFGRGCQNRFGIPCLLVGEFTHFRLYLSGDWDVYFIGDWDVHWGGGVLTHGHFILDNGLKATVATSLALQILVGQSFKATRDALVFQ